RVLDARRHHLGAGLDLVHRDPEDDLAGGARGGAARVRGQQAKAEAARAKAAAARRQPVASRVFSGASAAGLVSRVGVVLPDLGRIEIRPDAGAVAGPPNPAAAPDFFGK